MVHQRQRLPLGLEPGQHLLRVHPRLDDLERDEPLDRLGLLGQLDHAHAPLADLLDELVLAGDDVPGVDRLVVAGCWAALARSERRGLDGKVGWRRRLFQETARSLGQSEQVLDPAPQAQVGAARLVEVAARSSGSVL